LFASIVARVVVQNSGRKGASLLMGGGRVPGLDKINPKVARTPQLVCYCLGKKKTFIKTAPPRVLLTWARGGDSGREAPGAPGRRV